MGSGLNTVLLFAPSVDPRISVKAKLGETEAGEGAAAGGLAQLLLPHATVGDLSACACICICRPVRSNAQRPFTYGTGNSSGVAAGQHAARPCSASTVSGCALRCNRRF